MKQWESVKWLISILILLFHYTATAQSVFSGVIIDTNKNPVPYAHIQLVGSGLGTIANGEGQFKLIIPESYGARTISISSIGYVSRQIVLRNEFETILLQEDITELNQVTIIPRDYARELIEKAIENILENYPAFDESLRGFLREKTYWKNDGEGNPLYVAESVVESIKESYQKSSRKGEVKLIEGRKYESSGVDTLTTRIYGGPHHSHRFDAVAQRASFLSNPNNYEFEIQDTLRLDNRNIYEVHFFHKKGQPSGSVLIVDSTYAIAQARFDYKENFPINYRDADRQSLKYEVNYYQGGDAKWRLKSTNYITEFAKQGQILVLASNQVITNFQPNVNYITYLERIQLRDIFLDKTGEYDSTFWKNYNIILPDPKTEELFKKQPTKSVEKVSSEVERTRVQKIITFFMKVRSSFSVRYSPLEVSNYSVFFTNSQFMVNKVDNNETRNALSIASAFEYELDNSLFVGFESSFPISRFYNTAFDVHIIKEFNLNPKGRPILFSPKISFGYQQLYEKVGAVKSQSSYRIKEIEFDSGKTDIWLQQRGFRFSPSISLGIEKSNRLQFFVLAAYNFQINQKVGLFFDETDQFLLKQKGAFLENGSEGLIIDYNNELFNNQLSFSIGIYFSFL